MSGSSASPIRNVVCAAAVPVNSASAAAAAKTVFMLLSLVSSPRHGCRNGPLVFDCTNTAVGLHVRSPESGNQPVARERTLVFADLGAARGQLAPAMACDRVPGAIV